MRIKDQKDFFAGLMFVIFGSLTMWLSTTYNMGTAARMGPGYFPFWLGGTLTALGAIVLFKSLGAHDGNVEKASLKSSLVFILMMILSLGAGAVGLAGPNGALAIGTIAGCVLAVVIGERSMGLILGSVGLFGLFIKAIGVIICTIGLVWIAALASHEFKVKETAISSVVLAVMAWGIFVKGLGLQMPTWVDYPELQRMFQSEAKPAPDVTPPAADTPAPAATAPAAPAAAAPAPADASKK
ncbi:MAG TPA: tripartite tricarboxylate transporter TctB family protein [Burkholderiales bacterium]|jgi:hypothetical protein|nr:tripartite tricarboxylate transporter TctB family protein [Burkholderiales bacterium]